MSCKYKTGVYQIKNLVNDKVYIGSASRVTKHGCSYGFTGRFSKHLSMLKNNKHHSKYLQNAWNKYGEKNFKFEILAECPSEYCLKLEQWFIDNLNPEYNMNPNASSCLGRKLTKEHKVKIGLGNKGKFVSQNTKDKISFSNRAENNPDRGKAISKALLGKTKQRRCGIKMSEQGKFNNRDKRRTHKSITRLSLDDVREIKFRLKNKEKATIIVSDYKCSYSSIMDIKHDRSFKDIKIKNE